MAPNKKVALAPVALSTKSGMASKVKKPAVARKPSIAPITSAPSPPSPVTTLTTSKVWVLPPRPKPGRKPAVDTPPNKRKAQNRAAQRAFRERRAARVSELEEKLAEMARERDEREARLQEQLKMMMSDNSQLRKSVDELKVHGLGVSTPAASPSPSSDDRDREVTLEDLDRALEERLPAKDDGKCGFCIKDSCLCESVGLRTATPEKSRRNSEMEMDFTNLFARPSKKPKDACGFCAEGMPCVCADFEKGIAKLPPIDTSSVPLSSAPSSPTSNKIPALHPDPQSPKIMSRRGSALAYECTGDPGNCMQCQEDPMATLFCNTVASNSQTSTNAMGTFIPISSAYQTLSRHKTFNQVDLGQLVGKLHTRGGQVEVSSIANVLRELDRRFYD